MAEEKAISTNVNNNKTVHANSAPSLLIARRAYPSKKEKEGTGRERGEGGGQRR